jgi:hypothetical protein
MSPRLPPNVSRTLVAMVACLGLVACLPSDRINAACRWTDDATLLPPPGDRARRAHLIEDVRVAQDLGVRYGDAIAGRIDTPANREGQARCTALSIAEIMRRHGVSRAEIAAVTGARELWVDLVAVFLPVFAPLLLVANRSGRRLAVSHGAGERGPALVVLAIWIPMAGAIALGLCQTWGMMVEESRSRSDHVSFRAFQLPASRHPWIVFSVAATLFAVVAVGALLRPPATAPLTGLAPPPIRIAPAGRRA